MIQNIYKIVGTVRSSKDSGKFIGYALADITACMSDAKILRVCKLSTCMDLHKNTFGITNAIIDEDGYIIVNDGDIRNLPFYDKNGKMIGNEKYVALAKLFPYVQQGMELVPLMAVLSPKGEIELVKSPELKDFYSKHSFYNNDCEEKLQLSEDFNSAIVTYEDKNLLITLVDDKPVVTNNKLKFKEQYPTIIDKKTDEMEVPKPKFTEASEDRIQEAASKAWKYNEGAEDAKKLGITSEKKKEEEEEEIISEPQKIIEPDTIATEGGIYEDREGKLIIHINPDNTSALEAANAPILINPVNGENISIIDRFMRCGFIMQEIRPFFYAMFVKLDVIPTYSVPTMAVTVKEFLYNPIFAAELTEAQTVTLMMHELLHIAMRHLPRCGKRDHYLWNIACDAMVNGTICTDYKLDGTNPDSIRDLNCITVKDAKIQTGPDWVFVENLNIEGMSVEEYYDKMILENYQKLKDYGYNIPDM